MNDFVNRLAFLLEHFDFTASAFADKIGVQRSSLSHLLSGRNKPSLDLILKIKDCFPELNLDWLLQGKGAFSDEPNTSKYTSNSVVNQSIQTSDPTTLSQTIATSDTAIQTTDSAKRSKVEPLNSTKSVPDIIGDSTVDKVIVFYKDGTFKQYISR